MWRPDVLRANVAAACRIVPVLPSYSPDPWHVPSVENVEHSSDAPPARRRSTRIGAIDVPVARDGAEPQPGLLLIVATTAVVIVTGTAA